MFVGHFALGVATKKLAPAIPVWALLAAPQAMDLLFIPLVALGVEGYAPGPYGHSELDILYTHSLVGAIAIAAVAYWIGNWFWQQSRGGIILGGLSFSHWIIDLFVHHHDMPILPGNLGGLPMLGFGLWNFEYGVFMTEVVMAIIAIILYFSWARTEKQNRWWFIGPALIFMLFSALIISDYKSLPAF